MVAQSRDALYVAFMGTKQRHDILTNANVGMAPLWPQTGRTSQVTPDVVLQTEASCWHVQLIASSLTTAHLPLSHASQPVEYTWIDSDIGLLQHTPQAHRGFLRRARAVDVHSLYRHASEQGLRLVLCGKAETSRSVILVRILVSRIFADKGCCQL